MGKIGWINSDQCLLAVSSACFLSIFQGKDPFSHLQDGTDMTSASVRATSVHVAYSTET